MGASARAIFITGATSGIGAACARRFADDGRPLILLGRRAERLDALSEALDAPVHALPLDIRDRPALEAAIRSLPDPFATIDVLVNNAGISVGFGPPHEADPDDWDVVVDTNIKGVLYCTHAVLPGMVERGRGHIITIGSPAARHPFPDANVYAGTKAFVRRLSSNLRADLHGTDIRITLIEPGRTRTEVFDVRYGGDKARAAEMFEDTVPLEPEDVAEAVHWVTTVPARVNIDTVEMMPVAQTFAPLPVLHKRKGA